MGPGSQVQPITAPVFYARPEAVGNALEVEPALASWDKAGSPGQARSAAFIAGMRTVITGHLSATSDPLALRLDIGLPRHVPLLSYHDLDNYLFPLVPKLAASSGRQFASVWATKRHAPTSVVALSQAYATRDPGGTYSFEVTTTAAAESTAFKEQIRDQIAVGRPLPDGGVALQLAFVVGPRRAWPNLWKATIDSLGPILGRDAGAGQWNVHDGRVTDLGLHCIVDPNAGNRVAIAIRARTATPPTTE
ncbi:hypothetical protein BJY16_007438 [Actinoplanes octamycinicus]|uniref:Uncharacterized protein n=1 Tax=Actinoplanes octamycinicus TaxID=135948 RepID=A0A7W7H4U2_9ACTN|nr:hypothetical protein [Actinoplanes octamycinicus]MBB4743979.1 hypothetical protein [Actinoplanes octamycinicus]GIE58604.1 hypothetical protein Aoc01nite_40060 [Actinoplanes octamycinicus]